VSGHLTPTDLDALQLEVVAPGRRTALLAHVDGCDACREARAAHAADSQEFLEEVAPRTFPAVLRQIVAENAPRRPQGKVWAWPLLLVGVAAAFALWLRPAVLPERAPAPAVASKPDVGIKGGGRMHVYVKRGGHVFEIDDGAVLAPGDAVRFFVDPSGLDHLVVGSVDGAGKASIYFPHEGERSARVEPARRLEVPNSVVLDDAPGPERLFAVFSRAPLSTDEVRAALERLGARGQDAIRRARDLPLDGTLQLSFRFEKGRAR
jgi:hypothetical protein